MGNDSLRRAGWINFGLDRMVWNGPSWESLSVKDKNWVLKVTERLGRLGDQLLERVRGE